ncbi:MAG TPA: acetolactate synthase large subunit [Enteractinococcus sp.]
MRRAATEQQIHRPPSGVAPEYMSGAQAIVRSLEHLGVQHIFGIPGGAILPTYDALMDSSINHILVRHEQGAGHAAQGYAMVTGEVGVCLATSGPGATNLVTPLADADMDSVPIVAITGQVNADVLGTDAFQEADMVNIASPITKHVYLVTNADEIPHVMAEAFDLAASGRPGPVLIDVTKTAQNGRTQFRWVPGLDRTARKVNDQANIRRIQRAAEHIQSASRPVFYIGGGVIKANATEAFRALAETVGAPVVNTLMARGAFPDSHSLNLGMPGMHGVVAAVGALQQADLLITLGARFDDRVTGKLESFAPEAKVIHVDVDPKELSKNRLADVPIPGSLDQVLPELHTAVKDIFSKRGRPQLHGWWRQLNRLQEAYPLGWTKPEDGGIAPQQVIEKIGQAAGSEAVYVAGVGQHQMWSSQFIEFERPRQWLNSGGLGTMGYSVPAAMGAQIGNPNRTVWAIDGDGCFQMTNQELATCAMNNIPIKVAIINNSSLGMVRQWQTLYYDGRYSNSQLNDASARSGPDEEPLRIPDFVMLARSYGCVGLRCEHEDDIESVISQAMEINDRPVVIDFVVSRDSMVWPMVPAGVSNSDIQVARDLTPEWDDDA